MLGEETGQEGEGKGGGGGGHAQAQGGHSLGFLSPQIRGDAPHEVVGPLLQFEGFSALNVTDEPTLLLNLHLIGA